MRATRTVGTRPGKGLRVLAWPLFPSVIVEGVMWLTGEGSSQGFSLPGSSLSYNFQGKRVNLSKKLRSYNKLIRQPLPTAPLPGMGLALGYQLSDYQHHSLLEDGLLSPS